MHSIISASDSPLVIKTFRSSTHTENTLSLNPKSHLVTIVTSKSLDLDNHTNLFKPGLCFHEICELKISIMFHPKNINNGERGKNNGNKYSHSERK